MKRKDRLKIRVEPMIKVRLMKRIFMIPPHSFTRAYDMTTFLEVADWMLRNKYSENDVVHILSRLYNAARWDTKAAHEKYGGFD